MIINLLRLSRPYYSLPLSGGLIVITWYLTGGNFTGVPLLYAFLSLYSIISAGYILNDLCDIAVDKINRPDCILATDKTVKRTALIASIILFAAGLLIASLCSRRFLIVLTAIAAGLIIYDLFSKRMGLFKNVLVAILVTSLYPLSFTLADPVITPRVKVLIIHPAWLFFTAIGYEMLKDIVDTKGDSLIVDKRIEKYRSNPAFLISARLIILTASLLTLLPYLLGYCKGVYLASSILAITLAATSARQPAKTAIPFIYSEVFLITAGSLADLLIFGP
jgi:geranylgeranylglycerol-phosphate geranylgeranyltransferase